MSVQKSPPKSAATLRTASYVIALARGVRLATRELAA